MGADVPPHRNPPGGAHTLDGVRAGLDRGDFTAVGLVEQCIEAIEASAESVRAFVDVHAESAVEEARASDTRIRAGRALSAVDGVPFGVKDIIHIRGQAMAAGSRSIHVVPEQDAVIIEQLRRAGAIILGTTRLHELAYGPSGLNEFDGGARNPHFPGAIPGGSSSGSAAAVAAGLCPIALGTDTGGSIRGPATLCGVVGFKPSYGLLSTEGVLPTAPTLDHVGFLAGSIRDVQVAMSAITMHQLDEMSATGSRHLAVFEDPDVKVDSSIAEALDGVRQHLSRLGWSVDVVRRPTRVDVMDVSSTIMAYEAYRVHSERLRTVPEMIGDDVRNRLQDGERVTREQYELALEETRKLRAEMADLTDRYDALVNATIPIEAPSITDGALSGVRRQLVRNTRLQNLLGTPAVTVPGRGGPAPWGIQLFSARGRDAALLATASRVFDELSA